MRKHFHSRIFVVALAATFLAAASPHAAAAGPRIANCPIFPADNVWNARVDRLPVHRDSRAFIRTIGSDVNLHADFGSGDWPPGSGAAIGIPFAVVTKGHKTVHVRFEYEDESDPGPYPIPKNPLVEGGPKGEGDRHVILLDIDSCKLYELYKAYPQPNGTWTAGSGAVFDLSSNRLRPDGWTSADAAGLPILPGLVRYEDMATGRITHAIRFTAPQTRRARVWPARHHASSLHEDRYPPMGQRFRLKKNFDISGFSPQTRVILKAMKEYGIILADNGSAWYISGAPDPRWDNNQLREFHRLRGEDFEAVDILGLMAEPDSGRVKR